MNGDSGAGSWRSTDTSRWQGISINPEAGYISGF